MSSSTGSATAIHIRRERATRKLAGKTESVLANGSDNLLLDHFVDPALGCTPWTAPDLANPGFQATDLGLNDFRMDLLNYIKTHADLNRLPNGMHAVLPAAPDHGLPPGVIFALRNRNHNVNLNQINRLHPYYLVYVGMDGKPVVPHTEVKRLLDLVRSVCKPAEQKSPSTKIA